MGRGPANGVGSARIDRLARPRVASRPRLSSLLVPSDDGIGPDRVRNIGADVAVGDWVLASADGERADHAAATRSAFVRRASFEGARAVAHTLAANIDVVFLCHSFAVAPNQRRLERELVLAFDSGADPVVLLTKSDVVDDPEPARASCKRSPSACPCSCPADGPTADSTSADARCGTNGGVARGQRRRQVDARQRRPRRAAPGDDRGAQRSRGRHTTVAAELLAVPDDGGWLIDTPGVRAMSLWLSGRDRAGIQRRLRADGPVPLPRPQARSRTGRSSASPSPRVASTPIGSPASNASSPRRLPSRTSKRPISNEPIDAAAHPRGLRVPLIRVFSRSSALAGFRTKHSDGGQVCGSEADTEIARSKW